ncbi:MULTISPECIES: acyl-CoA thioesterase [unclassified Sedimentibacter]|uniref:acyl-CoA thioesterase n=1 Tax=unclassified Sedimentibacter TaxID=2649220 RepID=UPI0027E00245|nr:hotdog domain-containing protein [Sedimentibacter sp. MB35-C1]WMJ77753.1 hotdog domain-containing protein [Sedimentibacter sp. MB35-C1]
MDKFINTRLVKSEDLNHHGTLFAGRTAEWFVESAFIAASSTFGNPENIVCLNVHGLLFKKPVNKGEIVKFTSRIVNLGKTSIAVHTKMDTEVSKTSPVEGFITFICVDADGKKMPHGLVLDEAIDEEERVLRERAESLRQ